MATTSSAARRSPLAAGLVALVIIAAVVAGFVGGTMRASAAGATATPHTQRIVNTYLSVLNSAMAKPSCDFSQLSTVYTSDATLTLSGGPFAPGGPFGAGNGFGAQQFHGIQAITGAYTKLCHILYSKDAGAPSWTQDAGYLLSPNTLNSYEQVNLGGQVAGRCMHVFTVSGDRITSLDWSVYA